MSAVMEACEPSAKHLSALQPPLVQQFDLLATAPGGVAKLREVILTLAVQGKLVPQDARDEPASELLKKIRAEKDRLIAEGKIKRDKPPVPIAEEEKPFSLPDSWEWVRIPEVTHGLGQGEPSSSFSYIDVASIDNLGGRVAAQVQVLEAADAPSRARKNVSMGTVIYSTIRPYLKNIAVIEHDYSPRAIASTAFAVMHPHTGVLPKYLLHYLRSRPFTEYVNSKAVGVAYPAINDANFFQGVIALPPAAEQTRIVASVEELMRLCDALEAKGQLEAGQHTRLVQTLLGALTASTSPEELADNWQRVATHFDSLLDRPEAIDALEQTILQLALRGLLVPQDPKDEPASELLKKIRAEKDQLVAEGKIKRHKLLPRVNEDEKPFAVPPTWEWVRLGQIADSRLGKMLDKAKNSGKKYPYLRNTNVQWHHIDLSDVKEIALEDFELEEFRLRQGDLLICEGGYPGRCAIWNESNKEMYFQKALHRVRPFGGIPAEFLAFSLEADSRSGTLEKFFTGATIKHFVGQALESYLVPLPPSAELNRIVARVESLRRLCADLRQRLAARQTTQAHLAEALIDEVT